MSIPSLAREPVKTWTFLGHIDATSQDLQRFEIQRLDRLEAAPKNDSHVIVDVRNEPNPVAKRVVERSILAALSPAVAAVGVGVGAALLAGGSPLAAVLIGGDILAGGAVLSPLSWKAFKDLKRTRHEPETPGEDWKGARTYYMSQDQQPGLNSVMLGVSESSKAPSGAKLGQFLANGMVRFPAQRNAFILGGHGRAQDGVGGVSVEAMAEATRTAHEQSGRKLDVMVLDSCLVGNLETLLPMADHVRYAVVSEEPLYTGVIDWGRMVASVEGQPASANQLAAAALQGAVGNGSPFTLATVRMSQLPRLRESMEALGTALEAAASNGHRGEIKAAFKAATPIKDSSWLERKLEGKLDLGSLLKKLHEVPDAQVQQAAVNALAAYERAVVGNLHTSRFSETTGLSVQGPRMFHRTAGYGKDTGMPAWSRALGSLKPWPMRLFDAAKRLVS